MSATSEDRTLRVTDALWNVARIVEDGVRMAQNSLRGLTVGRDSNGLLSLLGYRSTTLDSSSTSLSAGAATDDDDDEQRGSSNDYFVALRRRLLPPTTTDDSIIQKHHARCQAQRITMR